MNIRTIEDNFDYQTREIFKRIQKDYAYEITQSGMIFSDWLWQNRKILGEYFYEKVEEYEGVGNVVNELNS